MRRAYFAELAAPRSDAEASVPTPIHHGRYTMADTPYAETLSQVHTVPAETASANFLHSIT